ncbi:apses-domain-containing protein [Xylona heveae TC161]|uniref:Apses-domain-containing protein n=1 Tax=Xylona heveae (strain CBS 132557 / TC161) TaxID=1328760 RepID=A0A164ZX75_XYLHT|nr:apses-domain-containing protein [Xylona heveae TC161]KZF19651.1 apses-domain-containing protein [Xylona heveae TC161]
MAQGDGFDRIYSATYSNVPVYEFNANGNHVMRRRSDDWINATHILKVADFDKPARTRILEREVQKGVHEKVQGGYGKYQGTWVPLEDGRLLAERNGVLEKLRPIFEFVPGDRSPPQAPKHTTAASNKPKVPRNLGVPRRLTNLTPIPPPSQVSEDHYDAMSGQLHDEYGTPDNTSIASESILADEELVPMSQHSTLSRKRKRRAPDVEALSMIEQQHLVYADELLDYFMLSSNEPVLQIAPPVPPVQFDIDRPIDDQGHTALHWAAAMGDLAVIRDLLQRGAKTGALSNCGETPLMRAVLFTNNFEKETMPKLTQLLLHTVDMRDFFGSTVFHHIAATTSTRSKFLCARYYMESIINKLGERMADHEVAAILNAQDDAGDTALIITARHGARKCVRSLIGHNALVDIRNKKGESADDLIRELNSRRNYHFSQASSSPFQMNDARPAGDDVEGSTRSGNNLFDGSGLDKAKRKSDAAISVMQKLAPMINDQADKLASAFDLELAERETDLNEAHRLLKNMQQEIEQVRKQSFFLSTSGEDEVVEQARLQEYNKLLADNESLLEHLQGVELGRLIHAHEENNTSTDNNGIKTTLGNDQQAQSHLRPGDVKSEPGILLDQQSTTSTLQEKLRYCSALYHEQNTRRALVREVVQNQSIAGLGERQKDYKRLIASALDIAEENVDHMLPEILQELEAANMADGIADSHSLPQAVEG